MEVYLIAKNNLSFALIYLACTHLNVQKGLNRATTKPKIANC